MSTTKSPSFLRFINSFRYALRGIKISLNKGEVNIRVHVFVAIVSILLAYLLHLSILEWSVIIVCIGIVIAAELFNTAIEKLVDLVSPEWNDKAGIVKDIAAGAVLIVSIASAIIGIIIFVPKIIDLFH